MELVRKSLIWTAKQHHELGTYLYPDFSDKDLSDPFYSAMYERFWPYVRLLTIEGTSLYESVATGKQVQINNQESDFGIVNATTTPIGYNRFRVDYEVSE